MDQEMTKGNSHVGHERTENQKGKRKENPADNVCGSLEKQDEYRRIPAYVEPSFDEAMEQINANILNFDLRVTVFVHVSTPARQLIGVIYCVGNILIGLEVPWVKVLKESPLSVLFDRGFPQIPSAFYKTVVNWTQHFDGSLLGSFVRWGSDLLLEHLVAIEGGCVGRKIRHSRAFRDHVCGSLYTWAYCLLPVAACNPESRDLILQFIEMILSNSIDREILLDNSRAILLIQPSSFEMLVRLTFPASRVEGTERFEKIYPLLKRVAFIAASKEEIRQIFTFSLKLAAEGISSNPVLAKEATSIGILCLEESFVDCCNHWDTIYKENLEASVALLQEMVQIWKDYYLKLSPSERKAEEKKQLPEQIFRFSLKFAGEGNPVLAKEAVSIAIWWLEESVVDCCDHWDNIYKENLEGSVALLQELVHKWKDHSLKLSSSSDTLDRTMMSFRLQNKKGITQGDNACLHKEADKYCKIILSRGSGKLDFTAVVVAITGAALALVLIWFHNVGIWE